MKNEIEHKVGLRGFTNANLLVINSLIIEDKANDKVFFREKIYFEFTPGAKGTKNKYDRTNKESITLDCFELRQLLYALTEIYKNGKTNFKKNSEFNKQQKILTVSRDKTNNFFINLQVDSKPLYFRFDPYEFLAFSGILKDLMILTEKHLYSYQRNAHNNFYKEHQYIQQ